METKGYSTVENWLSRLAPATQIIQRSYFNKFLKWVGVNGEKFSKFTPDELIEYQKQTDNGNRYDILEKIYNPNQELTQGQKKELFSSNDRVYIIARKAMFPKPYVYRLFDKVFQSSQGNFSVYCYRAKKPF